MSSSDLICPSCRAPLRRTESRWSVLACDDCGGVWTDRDASRRIVSAADRDLVRLASTVADRASDVVPPAEMERRSCPICGQSLTPVKAARVTVDICAEHGTWFDRDELGRLARNVAYERTSSADPTALPSGCDVLLGLLDRDDPDTC